MDTGKVRVRFAPSPTGMLHLGGARTALFNYLFARYHGGEIVLRVEDTDRERSSEEFERAQLEDLNWLGLHFDEGPYRQSERVQFYEEAARRLVEAGLVYEAEDEAGRRALYFRPPVRSGTFRDALRGGIHFSKVEDFVIRKSDSTPAYNFAVVVDDSMMDISHVVRGEEHLPNTARQALLYRALGEQEPEFLHLGLILGPDGKKLSKRHGAESVAEHRREGYLPEALVGYLALLGWSHPEGKEEFAGLDELAREWEPSRLGASPATFDVGRLLFTNARRIRTLPVEELYERVKPFLEEPLPEGRELLAIEAIKEEMRLLSEAPWLLREITGPVDPATFVGDLPESSGAVYAHTAGVLSNREIEGLEVGQALVRELRAWAKQEGIKMRDLLHPLRLALTGHDRGPEMAYLFAVLGAGESRARIKRAREARLGI
ncbi:MAG: glutamate--tRNA ligase [Actinobacteria bacterium]|nr:glutamate--tRNA ligase [Actinomycetota bacterium]MCA1739274.1 glutamate--tRNA ligase [Actinomycetota bacterium]